MISELFKIRHDVFSKLCVTVITFWLLTAQCTWTPEVKTLIHTSEKGSVALQTSSEFKIPPHHPQVLSESLINQILQGISQTQERGILQELFFSNQKPSSVFSPAQIEFLTPHLVEAFSKATSEELITFQIQGNEEGAVRVNGKVAVFSPTIFFLTLQKTGNYPGNSSKMALSSRNLQEHTTLMFSQKEAMLLLEDIHRLIKISPKEVWIAINYADLLPGIESEPKVEERNSNAPITIPQAEEFQPELNILEEQLQDLRKKVDEQAEEIRRLQHTGPN